MLTEHYILIIAYVLLMILFMRKSVFEKMGRDMMADQWLAKVDNRIINSSRLVHERSLKIVAQITIRGYGSLKSGLKKIVLDVTHKMHDLLTSALVRLKGRGAKRNRGSVSLYFENVKAHKESIRDL